MRMARGPRATIQLGSTHRRCHFAIDPADVTLEGSVPARVGRLRQPPPDLGIVKGNDAPMTLMLANKGPGDPPTANEGDTVTYTLTYNTNGIPQTNGVVTDVLPEGVTYVEGTASTNDEFTFVELRRRDPHAAWEAPDVTDGGTLTYDVVDRRGRSRTGPAADQRGHDRHATSSRRMTTTRKSSSRRSRST